MTDEYDEAIRDWVHVTVERALVEARATIIKNYTGDDEALEVALEQFHVSRMEF